jgi:alpha-L-rhamnosidase
LFGLKPIEDGWKRFTLQPDLGSLQWASVCLPTKFGNIIVDVQNQDIHVSIPKGTTLEWKGNSLVGPHALKDKL